MLTEATDFSIDKGESRSPFSINAGIDVAVAMNTAIGLLGAADRVASLGINSDHNAYDLIAVRYLTMASQALIDACMTAVESTQVQAGVE